MALMSSIWHPISTHPKDGRPFVAYDRDARYDSLMLAVVSYYAEEDGLRVVGRNCVCSIDSFTDWCEIPFVWQISGTELEIETQANLFLERKNPSENQ